MILALLLLAQLINHLVSLLVTMLLNFHILNGLPFLADTHLPVDDSAGITQVDNDGKNRNSGESTIIAIAVAVRSNARLTAR